MRRLLISLVMVLSIILLFWALGLGFLTSWNRADPNLHGMVAFVGVVLAIGLHIRGGSGLDFLAVVLLVTALALGIVGSDGAMSPEVHSWPAVFAVATSAGAQIQRRRNE
jgi:hypothetical protein